MSQSDWSRRRALEAFSLAPAAIGLETLACDSGSGSSSAPDGGPSGGGVDAGTGTSIDMAAPDLGPAAGDAGALSCVVRPEKTEGPYFVDEKLDRSDIRTDPSSGAMSAGTPLRLVIGVGKMAAGACAPLKDAIVDVWHCDALGNYSDVQGMVGKKYLRGFQKTNDAGLVEFLTIYPGWYMGRAVHIHFKIRATMSSGASYAFTSQWFFSETLNDAVHAQAPYSGKGKRDTLNARDMVYGSDGTELLLDVVSDGQGYAGRFDIGLQIG